jgi:threonine dehydrogenase-like Zn-dependent dehydrogenase
MPAVTDADVVFHCSGSASGLETALRVAGFEATIVEMSWYGDRSVAASLGESFHSRRLTIRSSQVGAVAASRRARWNTRRRMELAISLLADPALDILISGESTFDDLPRLMPRLAASPNGHLCHRIAYV